MCNKNISCILTTQATIQIVTKQMTYYGPIILLIVGIIGCLCNFLTFTSPKLRQNSCAFYFLCSSIFEFLTITFGLSTRLAADYLGSNLQNTNRIYCKIRAYLVSAIPLIATYFILLTAIDRCMSSSIHIRLRSFSQMKIVYRSVIITILIGLLSCSHILITYDLRPKCATLYGAYAIFDGMFVVFWLGFIPHILMLIFGLMTLIHIRQMRRRRPQLKIITPIEPKRARNDTKTDTQLILMMLVQVGLSSLLTLTRMIYYAYYILGPSLTGYNKMIGSFLMSFTTLLYYTNYAKSFYIYTLSSRLFRSVFLQRLKEYSQKIFNLNPLIMKNVVTSQTR
ncbi:unnamed protein product [Adineta steineri]|uniref:G-protein coupled receptors family 1 profile domain-containing protein n=1 Tax=Adineta steineri TaxID=433720 RepID=A0A814KH17_9BILA|nr:unnamed protein product [Adineta steineri]CAF3839344.1 unnamed protein product [Adineta steineri]